MAEPKKNDYDSTIYVKIENPEGIEYGENHLIIINGKLDSPSICIKSIILAESNLKYQQR